MAIPLRRAPEFLFDKERWAQFCGHFQTSDVALARISRYPESRAGFHCNDDPGLPNSPAERQKLIDETFKLGMTLIWEVKTKLINQEVTATGFRFEIGEREPIPASLWTKLWLEFDNGAAMGPLIGYSDVELEVVSRPDLQSAELVDRCTQWLRESDAAGETRRKVLESKAYDKFGSELTTRMFSAAYKAVHNRRRGRPRKN
jgi:hypothetical protein